MDMIGERVAAILKRLSCVLPAWQQPGIAVFAPASGDRLADISADTAKTLDNKISRAKEAQGSWALLTRGEREHWIRQYALALKESRAALSDLVTLEGGKTTKEALAEADGSADVLEKTIKDASLPELNGMLRRKERAPVGVVGLITSFNFPMAVAHWTLAPALLAANAVLWKPSEKTPLVAVACKAVFDRAMGQYADLLQVIIGGSDIGQALVAHESVGMVSATGSVGMGQGIRKTLEGKRGNVAPPVLELGGNNGVIISEKTTPAHRQWAVAAITNSFFGTTGQRCTNTRRLIVHKSVCDEVVKEFSRHIEAMLAAVVKDGKIDPENSYGYGALIDADAFARFEKAKAQVAAENGTVKYGGRLFAEVFPDAYYVEPALALLPNQTRVMYEETFAPLLLIAPYEGGIESAVAMVNAPDNAGLVNGIYTQSRAEAEYFARHNGAGHTLINSPKGTGTPAFGMGFGGNKESGTGEILNSADPLAAFTRPGTFSRVAENKEIPLE